MKRALEARGWEVIAVDMEAKFQPDVVANILDWDFRRQFPRQKYKFDIIAASPPCTEYSSAMTRRPRRMLEADALVERAKEIVRYYQPRLWWIENPRHGNLRWRQVVKGMAFIDLDYCKFELWGYRKPTRFWVPDWLAKEKKHVICGMDCQNLITDDKGFVRHRIAIGGQRRSEEREDSKNKLYRIPDGIIEYLTDAKVIETPAGTTSTLSRGVRQVVIKPHQHRPQVPFKIGLMENRDGGHQLLLTIHITIEDVKRTVKALIDTGAQVSIVRQGLLPDECFRAARKPLLLKTASGELLPGGQRVASLLMEIDAETDKGCPVKTPWKTNITVHDGDVGADMIIGYPWLMRQRLDIQPWRNALQLHDHPFWVLRPQRGGGRTSGVENRAITMDIMAVTNEDEESEVAVETDGEMERWIHEVQKMQLTLVAEVDPETGEEVTEAIEDEATIEEAAVLLKELNETLEVKFIRGVVVAENEFPGDFAANLRTAIQEQFEGLVFRDRIFPDPPERG